MATTEHTPSRGRGRPAAAGVAAGGPRVWERPGFSAAVLSEWTKLRTVRSMVWLLVAMVALTPALAVVVAVTGSLTAGDEIVASSLMGATVAQLPAAVAGALAMSSEYATGLIRTTLAATPRRGILLAAKAAVITVVLFALTTASGALAYLAGTLLLSDGPYPEGDLAPALLGTAVYTAVIGVLGVALGVILRRPAGAVTTVFGVLLLPFVLGGMLPATWARWIVGASPMSALLKLQAGDGGPVGEAAMGSLGAWPSLGLVAGYTLATLLAGVWLLRTRDA